MLLCELLVLNFDQSLDYCNISVDKKNKLFNFSCNISFFRKRSPSWKNSGILVLSWEHLLRRRLLHPQQWPGERPLDMSPCPSSRHGHSNRPLCRSILLQVTLETTIGNSNPALWKNVHPVGTVPEWLRNIVANRLATDGLQWAEIFRRNNSGT